MKGEPNSVTNATHLSQGFALVELFTSEGCSSCPPAEALVAKLPEYFPGEKRIYVLSYHVDYWDHLGWKDKFSNPSFSDRQRTYSSLLNCSVYTPQAIVNGATQFTGSDKSKMIAKIKSALQEMKGVQIKAEAKFNPEQKSVVVTYFTPDKIKKHVLQAVLVQKQSDDHVESGENRGRDLHHVNIVRTLQSTEKHEGKITIAMPDDLLPEDVTVILFLQDNQTFEVEGATEVEINNNEN